MNKPNSIRIGKVDFAVESKIRGHVSSFVLRSSMIITQIDWNAKIGTRQFKDRAKVTQDLLKLISTPF